MRENRLIRFLVSPYSDPYKGVFSFHQCSMHFVCRSIPMSDNFADDVILHLPRLRTVARQLVGNRTAAEDLMQKTVLRALAHSDQFEPGTNMIGWLSVILRHCHANDTPPDTQATSLAAGTPRKAA
jgi:hypothetical protein